MSDHESIRKKLLSEKERLETELKNYKAEDPFLSTDRSLTVHSIDNDSMENEAHDRIEGVREQLKEDLSLVLLALEKLDKGTYGKCEKCGQPIEAERLKANPTAIFCRQHAR